MELKAQWEGVGKSSAVKKPVDWVGKEPWELTKGCSGKARFLRVAPLHFPIQIVIPAPANKVRNTVTVHLYGSQRILPMRPRRRSFLNFYNKTLQFLRP